MKKEILLTASIFICALSLAQRRPPDQLVFSEPIPIDSLHCVVDSFVYCDYYFSEDSCAGVYWNRLYDSRGNLIYVGIVSPYECVYAYDTNGNIISCTQLNTSGSWIEQNLYSDFTAYGDPVYRMRITFGNNNAADTLQYKYAYTYSASGQVLELREWLDTILSITDSAGRKEIGLIKCSYTAGGNMDTMEYFGGISNPQPVSRFIYTYNIDRYAVTELAQNAGNSINLANGTDSVVVWVTAYYAVHYYYPRTDGECATSGISSLSKNAVKIYPNPFTDKLTIEPNISYRLFDLLGREMDKNNLGALPVGTYIMSTEKGSVRGVKGE